MDPRPAQAISQAPGGITAVGLLIALFHTYLSVDRTQTDASYTTRKVTTGKLN